MKRRLGGSDSPRFKKWEERARLGGVAPTLVGGSKRHGGADLGPTRAKKAWGELGVDAMGVANDEADMVDPGRDLGDLKTGPKLTVDQAKLIQGFPDDWNFVGGGKTARYRQVGNAFPPPVAEAVGESIREALSRTGPVWEDPSPDFEPEDDPSLVAAELPLQETVPTLEDDAENSARALLS